MTPSLDRKRPTSVHGSENTGSWITLFRCIIGTFEGAFQPITGAIIASNFGSATSKGMSIFNWGMYIGYGLSYQFSKSFQVDHIFGLDWRAAYVITGAVGLFIVPGMLRFVEVERGSKKKSNCGTPTVVY